MSKNACIGSVKTALRRTYELGKYNPFSPTAATAHISYKILLDLCSAEDKNTDLLSNSPIKILI